MSKNFVSMSDFGFSEICSYRDCCSGTGIITFLETFDSVDTVRFYSEVLGMVSCSNLSFSALLDMVLGSPISDLKVSSVLSDGDKVYINFNSSLTDSVLGLYDISFCSDSFGFSFSVFERFGRWA